jgi:hypothetical protein
MIGQHFFTKSMLKPSGPGDLSEGKLATTASIFVMSEKFRKRVQHN